MAKAYSYIRISSTEQRKGRGEERQLEAAQAYAAKHGLELDDTHRDLGRSGYHGDHVKKGGHLGRFLDLVAAGDIPIGSYLLVEDFTRLSRQAPIDAQLQFLAILKAGIKIVMLKTEAVYDQAEDQTYQLIIAITEMTTANKESSNKSYHSKKNHNANRRDMLAGLPRFQSACVGWIDQIRKVGTRDCTFRLNTHAKTVQRIFELADQGVGTLDIARLLNEAKTPPMKAIGTKWWETTVIRILKNETAIGTLQVNDTVDGKLVPMGDPIPNYYPAAVSEELFWRVQRNRSKAPQTGRKGLKYANLFQTITRCSHCGGGLGLVQSSKNDYKYYRCKTRYQDKTCPGPSALFPYNALENTILNNVTDFYLDSQLGLNRSSIKREVLVEQAEQADAEVAELEKRRKNAMRMSELADDEQTQIEFDARIRELLIQIKQLRAKANEAHTAIQAIDDQSDKLLDVSDMIAKEREMWTNGSDEEIFVSRSKVAQSVRRFISQIQVDFEQQLVTVYVAGYTRLYVFKRDGEMSARLNNTSMAFGEIAKMLREDGASDAEIAKAKEAHTTLKAA